MSRRQLPEADQIYDTASRWVDVALRADDSLFTPGTKIWQEPVLADLFKRFVEKPDETPGVAFGDKLNDQLRGADSATYQLMAEVLFVHLLPAARLIGGAGKRRVINQALDNCEPAVEIPPDLNRVLDGGLMHPGTFFNTRRDTHVSFLIDFALAWKQLVPGQRADYLADPWAFKAFVESRPDRSAFLQQAALLHLVFPATFEPVASRDHKQRIVQRWASLVSDRSADLDKQLLEIREALTPEYGEDYDYYRSPAVDRWKPTADPAPDPDVVRSLPAAMSQIMEQLASREGSSTIDPALKQLVEVDLPATVGQLIDPDRFNARGSVGMAYAADVPWVSVSDLRTSPSAQEGIYLVYLFASDGSAAYLSLNQGTERVRGGSRAFRKRALDIRASLPPQPDLQQTIDLRSRNTRPKRYEAANAYALAYTPQHVRSEDQLTADLDRMIGLLEAAQAAGLDFNPEIEPLHLVFKWTAEREPRTVDRHRVIAEGKGSVWWGRLATRPEATGMSQAKLQDVREQLETGLVTHAYLYRRGELWRTRLEEITTDPAQVDASLLPGYYTPSEANLFVRLSHFEELPAEWALENLVLASNPEPGAMPGALGNQTNPLFVYELFRHEVLPPPPVTLDIEWLERETLLQGTQLESILASLTDDSPQIILAGPPGTGKTWVAKRVARYLTGDETLHYRIVQFHPSYGYEEFVEGLRPTVKGSGLTFDPKPGVILQMAQRIEDSEQPHVLIVDEMNRANLPRVFGELMYLLEYREESVDLLYTEDFELPRSLHIIGTMNTADRSIRSVDVALRRRFDIFECPPDRAILERYYKARTNLVSDLIEGFEALNARLTTAFDRHHTIGHTFFMADPLTPEHMVRVWTHQIAPLIEEYFFDQPEVAREFELEHYWPSLRDAY